MMCRVLGMPNYKFVAIGHPISSASQETLAGYARTTWLPRYFAVRVTPFRSLMWVLSRWLEKAHPAKKVTPAHYESWRERLRIRNVQKMAEAEQYLSTSQSPIHPLRLCKEIRDFMDRDCILCVDGQEILNYGRQAIPQFTARHRINSGAFGTMGVGMPFGVGAKVAKPDKQVIVLHGDRSFGMNAMEFNTAMRHNLPVLTVISQNGGWTSDPNKEKPGRDLGYPRPDKFGEHGEYVTKPDDHPPGARAG